MAEDKNSPDYLLKQIKSFLFIGAGVSISTANTQMKDMVGAGIKVGALAFVCWCLYCAYKHSKTLASMATKPHQENEPDKSSSSTSD